MTGCFGGCFFKHRSWEHSYLRQFASNFLRNVQKWVFFCKKATFGRIIELFWSKNVDFETISSPQRPFCATSQNRLLRARHRRVLRTGVLKNGQNRYFFRDHKRVCDKILQKNYQKFYTRTAANSCALRGGVLEPIILGSQDRCFSDRCPLWVRKSVHSGCEKVSTLGAKIKIYNRQLLPVLRAQYNRL